MRGDVVLLYASKYHDIRTVIKVSGRFDLSKMEMIKQDGFVDVKNSAGDFLSFSELSPNKTRLIYQYFNLLGRRKWWFLPTKHGENLVGLLHDTGSHEIEFAIMVNVAAALEKEGITAFRFDFSGNGESEGSFEFGNYRREAEDLRAVIDHLCGANREYPDLPTDVQCTGSLPFMDLLTKVCQDHSQPQATHRRRSRPFIHLASS
ncbi:hypothetical protein Tsubulata_011427 [Turnera subulata]|uniref:Serine aminopeptidase S33 domain-containing protein n=1 Tax=Turnera subulata TaxID=218843 RepID=A0A9Q0FXB7_9ROSI|nr:hypothetical protein Tsubulata_011427 [Turnera subulata]